jgi:hypothetical protein
MDNSTQGTANRDNAAAAFEDGLAVEATAFYDSIAFNDLWSRVTPIEP